MDPKFSLTTSPVLTPQLKALLILYLITAITSDPWTQAIQPPNYMRQEFMFVPPTVNNDNRTEVGIIHRSWDLTIAEAERSGKTCLSRSPDLDGQLFWCLVALFCSFCDLTGCKYALFLRLCSCHWHWRLGLSWLLTT